jgi:hypothetical protein
MRGIAKTTQTAAQIATSFWHYGLPKKSGRLQCSKRILRYLIKVLSIAGRRASNEPAPPPTDWQLRVRIDRMRNRGHAT